MKEPNIGTPVEDDIRRHFGKELSTGTDIEIIPHTKVWATVDGVLLWDPKNGYADINKLTYTGTASVTKPHRSGVTNLKRVVYITGPQGSGKSRLVELMTDAVELNRGQYIGFTDLSRSIDRHASYSTVVICTNDLRPQAFNIENALRIWCRERKLEFININLK